MFSITPKRPKSKPERSTSVQPKFKFANDLVSYIGTMDRPTSPDTQTNISHKFNNFLKSKGSLIDDEVLAVSSKNIQINILNQTVESRTPDENPTACSSCRQ